MRLPLSALLSQVLVAFTIELDNEFERRMPHRTSGGTTGDTPDAPWLVSWAMWANFMRLLPVEGCPLRELAGPARLTNLAGLERWGYITVAADPKDTRTDQPRRDRLVRPTPAGICAQGVWRPLAGEIEERWHVRFGEEKIARLRQSLQAVGEPADIALPQYLPVIRHDMFAALPPPYGSKSVDADAADLDLPALLSRVLLLFTLEVESESAVSLPMRANVLRLLGEEGVRLRDIPRLAGVSKEAISMVTGFLEKKGCIRFDRDPDVPQTTVVRLTAAGRQAQELYYGLTDEIERRWGERLGEDAIRELRQSLEPLVGRGTAETSPLSQGLKPPPGSWRESVRKPHTLPHYPMVLHRGGFPDGE